MSFTVATWNVNSVRARLPRVLEWLERCAPDVVMLQETKCRDEQFPTEVFEDAGYRTAIFGQKTYNGVAFLSKHTIEDVVNGMPDEEEDAPARVIKAEVDGYILINVYAVNGKEVGSDKYAYKLDWYEKLSDYIAEFDFDERIVVAGDFNVTFDDRDVHNPEAWHEKILCSTPEREALRALMLPGLTDALRHFTPDPGIYTWWDFRTRGFQRGNGMRIDHFLVSEPALDACSGVEVDLEARGGEKPSDHAPVLATFDA